MTAEATNGKQEACPAQGYLLRSGPGDAAFNMALDEALLEAMPWLATPVLRFYSWTERAASFGYFQKLADVERMTSLWPLVRRPTGGGIVPHDRDWTYSVVFPVGHGWYALKAIESYQRIHEWIQQAFAKLNVPTVLAPQASKTGVGECFAGYEQFDLLWQGRKIAGAAQRRTRNGLLIQGSVQPPEMLSAQRSAWEKAMADSAPRELSGWLELLLDDRLRKRVDELQREKYSQRWFNERR
jgi:lipoate-protein ligase A